MDRGAAGQLPGRGLTRIAAEQIIGRLDVMIARGGGGSIKTILESIF
jgi:hypothetical protein